MTAVSWLFWLIQLAAALAIIAMGVAVVRRAHAAAGYLFAASGVVMLIIMGLMATEQLLYDLVGFDTAHLGLQAIGALGDCLVTGLWATSLILVAKRVRRLAA